MRCRVQPSFFSIFSRCAPCAHKSSTHALQVKRLQQKRYPNFNTSIRKVNVLLFILYHHLHMYSYWFFSHKVTFCSQTKSCFRLSYSIQFSEFYYKSNLITFQKIGSLKRENKLMIGSDDNQHRGSSHLPSWFLCPTSI